MKIKACVINLESRLDRKSHIINNIKEYWPELDYDIFKAISPETLMHHINLVFANHPELSELNLDELNFAQLAKLSCRLSHISVIANFIDNCDSDKYDGFLVMEDDCLFIQDMNLLVKKNKFPADWDFIYFYCQPIKYQSYNSEWNRIFLSKSNSCYLLNSKFIKFYKALLKESFIQKIYKFQNLKKSSQPKFGNEHIWSIDQTLIEQIMKKFNFFMKTPTWTKLYSSPSSINI